LTSIIRFRHFGVAAIVLLLLAWAGSLSAQTFRGSISGLVVDPSGAAVPNIEVKASNEATGVTYTTKTSSSGQYLFEDLPLGQFTIATSASGFQPLAVKNVTVNAGAVHALTLKLAIFSSNTTVNVTASALALDTQSSTLTTTVSSQTIENQPNAGRSFLQAASLAPGYAGYTNNSFTGAINGTRVEQVNYQINGTDNNDPFRGQTAANQNGVYGIPGVLFPIDAIEELSLQTQSTPEAGRNPGGVLNLVVKSGTNQVHGSAFYFNRDTALAEASPFLPLGQNAPDNTSSNRGGSFGGPIIRNRTFFFLAFEKQNFSIGPGASSTEPGTGYQAAARALLANYSVTENTVSTNLLNGLWPSNALAASAASTNNFFSTDNEYGYSYNVVAKVDHKINDKNNLSSSWYWGQGNQVAPVGSYLKSYYCAAPLHVQNYSVVWNSILTPRLTNQLLLGVDSYNQTFRDFKHNQDVAALGLVTESPFSGSPTITIGNFDPIGLVGPSGRISVTGHITDALSWVVGKHQIRAGGEFRKVQTNEFYYNNAVGSLDFNGKVGPWGSSSADSYVKALADFLAGYSDQSSIAYGDATRYLYQNTTSLFVHDTWQLAPRLSVNYGVRWDYLTPVHNDSKDLSTFVPSLGGVVYQGNQIGSLYPGDWTNFSPRLGFSYQPKSNDESLVIRGGFGIYYDTPAFDNFVQATSPNNGAGGIQDNPGGPKPVNSYTQGATTIVSGQNFFANAALNNSTSLFSVSQKFRTPRDVTYNLQIEKSLGGRAIVQLGYVGLIGKHLTDTVDINRAALNSSGTIVQSSRPYYAKFPKYTVINQLNTDAVSNYNSLQAVLKLSAWHGLTAQAAYTWSHNLDDSSSPRAKQDWPQDSLNLKANYGNSDSDQRHTFIATLSYAVPNSKHGPRWLTNDWTLNSLLSFHTGNPFTVLMRSLDTSGTGDYTQFAQIVGDPFAGVSHRRQVSSGSAYVQWINPDAFAAPAAGTFGNQRRNQIFGPGYADVDLSAFKSVRITGRVKAQLRAELFNVFTRVNLGNPSYVYSPSGFGTIGATIGASSANGAPGIGPGEPFNAQLGLKVIF
jgi:hypothetical protein